MFCAMTALLLSTLKVVPDESWLTKIVSRTKPQVAKALGSPTGEGGAVGFFDDKAGKLVPVSRDAANYKAAGCRTCRIGFGDDESAMQGKAVIVSLTFGPELNGWQSILKSLGLTEKGAVTRSYDNKGAAFKVTEIKQIEGLSKDWLAIYKPTPGAGTFMVFIHASVATDDQKKWLGGPESTPTGLGPNLLEGKSPEFFSDPSVHADFGTASDEVGGRMQDFRVVDISKAGTEDWMIQFYWQLGRGINGERLRLEFMAKSEVPTKITVRCQQTREPYDSLGLSEVCQLGTTWKKFSFDFDTKPADDYTVPIFWFGKVPTFICIADVSLRVVPRR